MIIARGLVALILIPFVGFIHFLLATQFEVYERRPIWVFVVILASLIVLARLLIRSDRNRKAVLMLNIFAWSLAITLIWWLEFYSQYSLLKTNYSFGQKINFVEPEGLVDTKGNPVSLGNFINKNKFTLLTFYRGHW